MIRWPGVTQARSICNQYVAIQDFYPTILDIVSIKNYKTVQKIDGQSMVPYLKNPTLKDDKRVLIWNFPNDWTNGYDERYYNWMTAIRQGDWKLIYFEKYGRLELYNLKDDIKEENDLSKTDVGKTKEMAALLTEELKSSNAQMPTFKATGKQVPWPDELLNK
jgi:arylsulfatase A-like enzyme